MKKLHLCLMALAATSVLRGGTVIADFNDLALGDLNGKTGGTGLAGTWINNSAGVAETSIDVIAGDLGAPAGTNYGLPQTGSAAKVQNTTGTTSIQTRTLATALTGNTVWFSFLLNQPSASAGSNAGSRGGICFNQPTTGSVPSNPRVVTLGSQLTAWLTNTNQIVANDAITAGATNLILGRITVNDAGNDTLDLWLNPNVNALGAPVGSFSGADWIGTGGITSVSVQSYGAGNGGIVDAVRLSDDTDAFTQVTGSTIPDPVFSLAPSSTSPDYQFGAIFPGTTSRTVTYRNEGPNNALTIQSVALTNNAGGVFSVVNVTPPAGSVLAPGQSVSVQVAATSASGGDFTGQLIIDTNATNQDKTLPVTASVYRPGQKLNSNGILADALAPHWTDAAFVAPGIAPGSPTMARVRGKGDKGLPLDETDSLGQQGSVPDGAPDWELACHFTPVRAADFAEYTGDVASGSFADRTFQLAVFTGNNLPATSMTEAQSLQSLLQIAYLPAGNGTTGEGFYAFDGAAWTRLNGLPVITGSIDVNADGLLAAGTDTVNAYRLRVRGSGFGTGSASYSVTVSGGELAAPVTQGGITFSAAAPITLSTPGSFTFTTSDTSTLTNGGGGFCTPFWVDDVFYHAVAVPDPCLTAVTPLSISGFNQSGPTGTLVLRNDGTGQTLNVTGITFGDTALSVVSPTLPIALPPGATTPVVVQLDQGNLAPDNALLTTVTVANNDPSQPSAVFPVTVRNTASDNQLANWNLETPGTSSQTDRLAFWDEYDPVRVRPVPGLLAGSPTAIYLDSTGATTGISQTLPERLADFDLTAGFAVRSTAGRAFNAFLSTGAGQLNLRYEGSVWSAFDGTIWQPLINMTSAPLTPSVDSNFDGDFLDAGESFTAYKLHLTGSGWGTATPTYQIRILNAAGQPVASGAGPFSFFQNGTPTTLGLATVSFDNLTGGNPGFWVDDVKLSTVTTTGNLAITAFTVNRSTGAVSVTFTSTAGTSYRITASNDLGLTDDFSQVATVSGNAGTTTVNFTDSAATAQARRFYRVETP